MTLRSSSYFLGVPLGVFALFLAPSCSTDDGYNPPPPAPRVDWEFGAIEGAGGAGGAGGGSALDPSAPLSLQRFLNAQDDFKRMVKDCNTFADKAFGYPRYGSLPYYSDLFECIVESDKCASTSEFMCSTYPDEWVACFQKFETFTCENGKLIPGQFQCDTIPDCAGAEEELGCQELWFQCDDGTPIVSTQHCDGKVHCSDGSDEDECNIEYFLCDSQRGIPDWQVCDGEFDCADETDEKKNCVKASCD